MSDKKEIHQVNENMLFSFKPVIYQGLQNDKSLLDEHFNIDQSVLAQTDYCLLFSKSCIKAGLDPNQDIMQAFKRREKNNEEVLKLNIGRDFNNVELKILCEAMVDYPMPFAFKLIDTKIGTQGLQIISQLLLVNENLRWLYLKNNDVVNLQDLCSSLVSVNSCLMELIIIDNDIGNEGCELLVDTLKHNKIINRLGLNRVNINDKAAQKLAELIINNQSLSMLLIEGNKLSFAGVKILLEALPMNERIKEFVFAGNPIGNDICQKLSEQFFMRFLDLNLSGCQLTYQGVEQLCQKFRRNDFYKKCLTRSINLSNNRIGTKGCLILLQTLKEGFPSLKYLLLENNKIGNKALAMMIEYLKLPCRIEKLNLSLNLIDENGLYGLLEVLAPSQHRKIKEINLKRNYISKAFVSKLSAELRSIPFDGRVLLDDQIAKSAGMRLENEERLFDSKDDVEYQLKEVWSKYQNDVMNRLKTKPLPALENIYKNFLYFENADQQINDPITEIRIDSHPLSSYDIEFIGKLMIIIPTINSIIIDNCGLSLSQLEALLSFIQTAPSVTYLNLRNNGIGYNMIHPLIKILSERQQALDLNLEGNDLRDVGVQALVQYMKVSGINSKISRMNLAANNITINSITALSESLNTSKYLLPLNELVLDKNEKISNEGAIFIFEHMKQNNSVLRLSLNNCNISDAACPTISEFLKVNTKLISLSMENNLLGNRGLQLLIPGLMINTVLQELMLRKNNFGEGNVLDFERKITGPRNLKRYKLDAARSSSNILEDMSNLIPSSGMDNFASKIFSAINTEYISESKVPDYAVPKQKALRSNLIKNKVMGGSSKNSSFSDNNYIPKEENLNRSYESPSQQTNRTMFLSNGMIRSKSSPFFNPSHEINGISERGSHRGGTGEHRTGQLSFDGFREQASLRKSDVIGDGSSLVKTLKNSGRWSHNTTLRSPESTAKKHFENYDSSAKRFNNLDQGIDLESIDRMIALHSRISKSKKYKNISKASFKFFNKKAREIGNLLIKRRELTLRSRQLSEDDFIAKINSEITDQRTIMSYKEELQRNKSLGDMDLNSILENNHILRKFDGLLIQIANNSDRKEREILKQSIQDFWMENKRIENSIDDLLADMGHIDEKIEVSNLEIQETCRVLDEYEDSIRDLLQHKGQENVKRAESLYVKKTQIKENLERLLKQSSQLKEQKLLVLKNSVQYLEALKELREKRLGMTKNIFTDQDLISAEFKQQLINQSFGQIDRLVTIHQKLNHLSVQERKFTDNLNLISSQSDQMMRDLINLCKEEEKVLVYLEDNRKTQIMLKSIARLLSKEIMIPLENDHELKGFKCRFQENIDFYDPLIEEEVKIEGALRKTLDTLEKFNLIINLAHTLKKRKSELIQLLENSYKLKSEEEVKTEKLRKLNMEITKKMQQKTHMEEDLETIKQDADLQNFKKVGFILNNHQVDLESLIGEKNNTIRELELIIKELLAHANLIKSEYNDILNEVFPIGSLKKLDLRKIQDIKLITRALRRTSDRSSPSVVQFE